MPTVAASRQRHAKRHERFARLETSRNPAAGQSEIAPAARRTPTTHEDLVVAAIDERGIVARLDIKYENHVLIGGSGVAKLAGAASLLWRTSPRSANRHELRDDVTASVQTTNWDENLTERESRHRGSQSRDDTIRPKARASMSSWADGACS